MGQHAKSSCHGWSNVHTAGANGQERPCWKPHKAAETAASKPPPKNESFLLGHPHEWREAPDFTFRPVALSSS